MDTIMKLTAEQKGILLKELLSFLLSKNGRAKKEDVFEHFLNKAGEWNAKLSEDDYIEQVMSLSTMCVGAEWIKKDHFWKVTQHGEKAYERFNSPKVLFQEMAAQFIVRKEDGRLIKQRKSIASLFILALVALPCTLIGFLSPSPHLFYLSVFAILLLLTSFVLYNSRTKLIILWRIFIIEFLALCFILVMDIIFATSTLREYFQAYFFITLVIQITCIVFVFTLPCFSSKVFEFINHSKWLIIISIFLLILLFGGRYPSTGGLLQLLYGEEIHTLSFLLVYPLLMGIGMIYISGGIVSNLVRLGYYD